MLRFSETVVDPVDYDAIERAAIDAVHQTGAPAETSAPPEQPPLEPETGAEVEAALEELDPVVAVDIKPPQKRGHGRPKGARNKPKDDQPDDLMAAE